MLPNMFPKDLTGMFPSDPKAMEDMMKPGRDAFEFWISFFPTAPLFGVEYRFGDPDAMMKAFMDPMATTMPTAKTNGAAKTTAKAAPKAAPSPAPAKSEAAAPVKAAPKTEAPAAAAPAEVKAEPTAEAEPKPVAKPKAKAAPKTAAPKAAEPNKAEPKKAASKKAAPKPADGTPASLFATKPAKVDDLKLIKGIGPGLEKELNKLGVYQFEQMSGFSKADLEWIDTNLSAFKGRCFRDDWVGQASGLMA